jgi:CDP-diacylglycerol pyrophosphatase
MRNLLSLLALTYCVSAGAAHAEDHDTLRKIVVDGCVPHMMARNNPAPCTEVDLAGRTAVLKDRNGTTQFLLIPTEVVTGIEDPKILAPDAPNYFQAAWTARHYVLEKAGWAIPRDDLGLAINSKYGRSQNQLHIHVACARPDVRAALLANKDKIGKEWGDLDVDLAAHRYRAMRIDGDDLAKTNPFKLLADTDPQARADMGRETLAAMGATFADGKAGFILLSDRADPAHLDLASSGGLLDHDCPQPK